MVQVFLSSISRNIIYTSHMENSENINSLNPFSAGNFLVSVAFQIILIIPAIVHRNYLYERIEIERNNISLLLDLKVSVKFQNQMNYSLHWTLDIACLRVLFITAGVRLTHFISLFNFHIHFWWTKWIVFTLQIQNGCLVPMKKKTTTSRTLIDNFSTMLCI